MQTLHETAQRLADALATRGKRIVFAESCTAGLVSASLASVPGISEWHCGSAVTYREQTKIDWLGLSAAGIAEHNVVSQFVASEMARGVLMRTAEADLAVAITGHLGPDAPADLDGVIHMAGCVREDLSGGVSRCHRLNAGTRADRQAEAAGALLELALELVLS